MSNVAENWRKLKEFRAMNDKTSVGRKLKEFLEHIQYLRDHAQNRIEQEVPDAIFGKVRAIPLDSPLNAYLQGQRDVATELLARARDAGLEESTNG